MRTFIPHEASSLLPGCVNAPESRTFHCTPYTKQSMKFNKSKIKTSDKSKSSHPTIFSPHSNSRSGQRTPITQTSHSPIHLQTAKSVLILPINIPHISPMKHSTATIGRDSKKKEALQVTSPETPKTLASSLPITHTLMPTISEKEAGG